MRYAGINIPVFSLRSKKGLGTGEFLDLIPLIDWCKEAGLKVIQILPVHDTTITETKGDSSPYSILSTFSLHPIYLNILALAPEFEEEVKPIAKILNQPHLDYRRTYLAKIELLKMLYLIRGKEDLSSKAFDRFFKKNESHLKAYAAFSILKEQFKTSDFHQWVADYSHYSELLVDEICERKEVKFFYFVQFHLHQQLKEVVHYAKEQGVLLKGDLPIGIHPHSVDAWRFADYFTFDKKMFTTYKWDEIKADGFYWLKARLEWLEQYNFSEKSICTPSTHDRAPIRAWWEEDEEKTALYYHTILKRTGLPPKTLTADLAHQIIQDYLNSKSKMVIFLLQDLLAMSDALKFPDPKGEGINDWNWRCHIYIEEFLLAKSFSNQIREMVRAAKR